MDGNNCALDTMIVAAILNGEPGIEERLKGRSIYLFSTVVGELYFGVYKSGRVAANIKRLKDFIADYPILPCDEATAEQYGQVKQRLKAKGRPIPENDMWIAAAALQHALTLVSRDKHFNDVDGLSLEVW